MTVGEEIDSSTNPPLLLAPRGKSLPRNFPAYPPVSCLDISLILRHPVRIPEMVEDLRRPSLFVAQGASNHNVPVLRLVLELFLFTVRRISKRLVNGAGLRRECLGCQATRTHGWERPRTLNDLSILVARGERNGTCP